jgi:protein TonB
MESQGDGKGAQEGKPKGGTSRGDGREGQAGNAAQPDYRVNPKPPYPMLARRLGAQGVVLLRVQVREDGSVAAVELAHSCGFPMLDESATRTVRESWQFLPARIEDGTPVASWVEVPIRFVLKDS